MAATPDTDSDAHRLAEHLNALDRTRLPTWSKQRPSASRLVDLSREEFAIRDALTDLEQARAGFDAVVDPELAAATDADIADHRARLEQIEARPGRYFLASGEVVQRDDVTGDAYKSGWWYDQRTTLVKTPHGERIHRPGIHRDASIDPTAHVDPTARIESGATIGPRARIGAQVHIGRDASIGANSVIQDGTWIGTNTEIGAHTWVSHGATVEPHCVIGHHTTVGAGARIVQGCQVEPYSRLGASTTTSEQRSASSTSAAHRSPTRSKASCDSTASSDPPTPRRRPPPRPSAAHKNGEPMSEPQPKDPYPMSLERAVGPAPATWLVFPLFIMPPIFGFAMARTTTVPPIADSPQTRSPNLPSDRPGER